MSKPKTCKACGHEFFIEGDLLKVWNNYLMPCPKCWETFSVMKPYTERDLQRLQYRYKGCSDEKLKNNLYLQMYVLLFEYSKSLILKHCSNLIDCNETLEEKATDVIHFLLEEYLRDEKFRIEISFGGFLIDKIKQIMFGKKYHANGSYYIKQQNKEREKEDEEKYLLNPKYFLQQGENKKINNLICVTPISINYKFADDSQVEYEDRNDFLKEIEQKKDTSLTVSYIVGLLIEYKRECNDRRENLRRLIATHFFLTYGERKVDNFFKVYGRYGKMRYEETIMLLKHELRRLHRESD